MCGIYGGIGIRSSNMGRELLSRMGEVVFHRGPDDEGCYIGRDVVLGIRRLSIIDVEGGHQPFSNEDKTVWAVCNGEIYNFRELRKGLEERGHRFRSHSDSEVIVHLYEEEGPDIFKMLRGMFGVALWDERRSCLFLGRDRLGKKPLYFRKEANCVLFGSELKCILGVADISRRIDPQALQEYLTLGYVPAPFTLLEGIKKVLPGHYLMIKNGQVSEHEYWDVRFDQIEEASEEEWVERIREKFIESVRVRLVSDVPLGAFLSGGIDSSAIVAVMAELTNQPVKTYSIGFTGDDRFYNELPYARIIADKYKTDHHEIIVKPEVHDLLPKLIWHLDEPVADSAFITTYLVSELARDSVKVILSGVGGDELFGGYRRYLGEALLRYYNCLPRTVRSKWLPSILKKLPQDRHSNWKNYVRYASAFVNSANLDPIPRYMSYTTVFSSEIQESLLKNNPFMKGSSGKGVVSDVMKGYFQKCNQMDSLSQMIYVDIKTSLPDDLLALTDRMSMAASIECRAPFLDHELLEMTSRIPSALKIRGFSLKHLLKKVVKPWLPGEIINRKKRGFGAPMGAWLRKDLEFLINETLSEAQIKKRGLFQWKSVKETIERHRSYQSDHTDHLLALINLELWCRIFLDGDDWKIVR